MKKTIYIVIVFVVAVVSFIIGRTDIENAKDQRDLFSDIIRCERDNMPDSLATIEYEILANKFLVEFNMNFKDLEKYSYCY